MGSSSSNKKSEHSERKSEIMSEKKNENKSEIRNEMIKNESKSDITSEIKSENKNESKDKRESKNKNKSKSTIIWIDKRVNNQENKNYISFIDRNEFIIIPCEKIEEGLYEIKRNKNNFGDIYVILSGSYYNEFVFKFKKYLKYTFVVPKIIIFTKDEKLFSENNDINDIINKSFYNLGGVQISFQKVYNDLIRNKTWKKEFKIEDKPLIDNNIKGKEQYTFEYINNKIELYLPVFYKSLIILNNSKDIFGELTHYLNKLYSKNPKIRELLEPIDGISDAPIEILCKYYARLYTIDSDFYKDINKYLRERDSIINEEDIIFWADKNNYPITYIKSFYEGLKLGCFKISSKKKLYRFSCIGEEELKKIKEYLKKKNNKFQIVYFFSKSFLSFSEDEDFANNFYNNWKENNSNNINLIPCKFHLINEGNIEESLFTHVNIQNISVYNEKEILFLPFTCFEITKITPVLDKNSMKQIINKKTYEYFIIELNYLGKYRKELNNIEKKEIIPETIFKQSIEDSTLIDRIPNLTNEDLVNEFNKYEELFRKNNEDIYIIYDVKNEDIDENGYVSVFGRNEKGSDFVKENKKNIKIIVNYEEQTLDYKFKLCKGYNVIFILKEKNEISSLNYMFYKCTSLKNIEGLKYLNTKNITNFINVFNGCESLSELKGLENWDVSNVNYIGSMFTACESLTDITALENWDVSNCNNFIGMFCDCILLSDITVLQNWNVSNGKNFQAMFSNCVLLSDITPLKYWDVSNGKDFVYMFHSCKSLSNINALEKWNVSNGVDFEGMFDSCIALSEINGLQNWNVSKINNFSKMFNGCESLSNLIGLQNWNVSNSNNFSKMFNECKILMDISALNNWNISKGNNFEYLFASCELLSDIKALRNWNVSNGINFSNMFSGCKSLSNLIELEDWNVSKSNNFSNMFLNCESLYNLAGLENWNVSNVNNFSNMFCGCKSLSDIKGLILWNVSNGINFSWMFGSCESLYDIKTLQNWNVSNGVDFQFMFTKCNLSELIGLENWNVSNGNNFQFMFFECKLLSDIRSLKMWNVSNGNNFSGMFMACESLLNIEPLAYWDVSKGESFLSMFYKYPLINRESIQNWNTNGFPPSLIFDRNPFQGSVFAKDVQA